MCEKKPGPRCSSDAYSNLEWARHDHDRVLMDESYNEDSSKRDELAQAVRDSDERVFEARLQYNATPEGLASLKGQVKVAASLDSVSSSRTAVTFTDANGRVGILDYADNQVPSLEVEAAEAEKYRHWQRGAAHTFELLENQKKGSSLVASIEARSIAQRTLDSYTQAEEAANANLALAARIAAQRKSESIAAEKAKQDNPDIEVPKYSVSNLRTIHRQAKAFKVAKAYAAMQVKDLLDYERNLVKKASSSQ